MHFRGSGHILRRDHSTRCVCRRFRESHDITVPVVIVVELFGDLVTLLYKFLFILVPLLAGPFFFFQLPYLVLRQAIVIWLLLAFPLRVGQTCISYLEREA